MGLFVIATAIVVGFLNFSTGKHFLIEEKENDLPENMYPESGMDYECIAFCNINFGFDNSRTKNDIGTQQNVKTLNKNQARKSTKKESEQQRVPKAKQEDNETLMNKTLSFDNKNTTTQQRAGTLNKNQSKEVNNQESEHKHDPRVKKADDREEITTNNPIEQISRGTSSFFKSPIVEYIPGGVASMLGTAGRTIIDSVAIPRYGHYYPSYYQYY